MKLKDICAVEQELQTVRSIQRTIDIIIAGLLISGQITIVRIIVEPGGFALSAGGPLTGRSRLEGKLGSKTLSLLIDISDLLLAILLISDQTNVSGIFIGPGRFSFNITGPIFGVSKNEPSLPNLERIFTQFRWIVSEHFNVDPQLLII
ncbi:hypothetical protein RCG20_14375 [Neobacillus sp. PS3-40]|nr:hypothetical protein [Neobacillus sp. PS3-40]WML43007.1 hypothetical protein RCG20_14375 [Neobacillus sp. PS3-40]